MTLALCERIILIMVTIALMSISFSKGKQDYQNKNKEAYIEIPDGNDYNHVFNWKAGTYQSIKCVVKNASDRVSLDVYNPSGELVQHKRTDRVFLIDEWSKPRRGYVKTAVRLTFNSTSTEDSGQWHCRVNNTSLNHAISICVIDELKFLKSPTDHIAPPGRSLSLECKATGDPAPVFQWYRNDQLSNDEFNSKYRITTKYTLDSIVSTLTIIKVNDEDAGQYKCQAIQKNALANINCTHTDSKIFNVQVTHAPTFKNGNESKNVYGVPGERVLLHCDADGVPTPDFIWYKYEGEVLVKIAHWTHNTLPIEFDEANVGQKIICRVKNNLGDIYKMFYLNQMFEPPIPNEIEKINQTETELYLNLIWNEDIIFPVQGIEVEYLSNSNKEPSDEVALEDFWKEAKNISFEVEEDSAFNSSLTVAIIDDNIEWVRVRVRNQAGQSPWSNPIKTFEKKSTSHMVLEELANLGLNIYYLFATIWTILIVPLLLMDFILSYFAF